MPFGHFDCDFLNHNVMVLDGQVSNCYQCTGCIGTIGQYCLLPKYSIRCYLTCLSNSLLNLFGQLFPCNFYTGLDSSFGAISVLLSHYPLPDLPLQSQFHLMPHCDSLCGALSGGCRPCILSKERLFEASQLVC